MQEAAFIAELACPIFFVVFARRWMMMRTFPSFRASALHVFFAELISIGRSWRQAPSGTSFPALLGIVGVRAISFVARPFVKPVTAVARLGFAAGLSLAVALLTRAE